MNKRRIIEIIVLALVIVLVPVSAFASTNRPYKDVTPKRVGKTNCVGVYKCKKWGATRVWVKKGAKKLHPFRKVTRREMVKALAKASKTSMSRMPSYEKPKKTATVGWFAKYSIKLCSETYGMTIQYDKSVLESKEKLDRSLGCGYIYLLEKRIRLRKSEPIPIGSESH